MEEQLKSLMEKYPEIKDGITNVYTTLVTKREELVKEVTPSITQGVEKAQELLNSIKEIDDLTRVLQGVISVSQKRDIEDILDLITLKDTFTFKKPLKLKITSEKEVVVKATNWRKVIKGFLDILGNENPNKLERSLRALMEVETNLPKFSESNLGLRNPYYIESIKLYADASGPAQVIQDTMKQVCVQYGLEYDNVLIMCKKNIE